MLLEDGGMKLASLSAVLFVLSACASAPPPPPAPIEPTTAATTTSGEVDRCEVTCASPRLAVDSGEPPDVQAAAIANVDQVFASMHDDLLACYRARVAVDPSAHAFLTIDIILGPDGKVRDVETTGGAHLGDRGLGCIVRRIKAASFEPIPGGGTRHIQVPLTLRRIAPGEAI